MFCLGLYSRQSPEKYGDCKVEVWNPGGEGLNFMDWSIPIFLLTDLEEIKALLKVN